MLRLLSLADMIIYNFTEKDENIYEKYPDILMSCTIYHQCIRNITLNFRPLYYHDISSLKIEENSGFSKK